MLWKNQFIHVFSIFSRIRVLRISYYSPILNGQKIIAVRKDIVRSLVQALAQSRISCGLRLGFLGLYPGRFGKLPRMETATVYTEMSR